MHLEVLSDLIHHPNDVEEPIELQHSQDDFSAFCDVILM